MKRSLVPFVVLLYCIWMASSLFENWYWAPMEHYAWIPLVIWLVPWIVHYFKSMFPSPYQTIVLFAALLFSLLGEIGETNFLKYIGLALAFASWLPLSWQTVVWFICSCSWMPASGWFLSHWFSESPISIFLFIRLAIAVVGSGMMFTRRSP